MPSYISANRWARMLGLRHVELLVKQLMPEGKGDDPIVGGASCT